METKEYKVNGMHCASCEVLVERNFRKIPGVHKVSANHATGRARVHYHTEPSLESLNDAMKEAGYSVSVWEKEHAPEPHPHEKPNYDEIGALFAIVLGAYFLLKQFNLIPNIGINNNMSYGFVFVIGLVAAVSTCMAVTGGLLVGVSAKYHEKYPDIRGMQKFRPHLYFNIGRILSYTLLGGLLGIMGGFLAPSAKFTAFLTVFVSFVMIILGVQLLNIFPFMRNFMPKMPKFIAHKIHDASGTHRMGGPFMFGALTFFLPCGFTQALQLYVLAKGSFAIGALTMLAFSLGTMPALMSLGIISSFAKGKFQHYFVKTAGVVIVLIGIMGIFNGFSLTGILSSSSDSFQNPIAENIQLVDGKQIIEMKVDGYTYTPNSFTLKKGVPVEWHIDGRNAAGCAHALVAPDMGIREYLPGDSIKVITFTPQKTGIFRFTCSMGMAGPGQFRVVA